MHLSSLAAGASVEKGAAAKTHAQASWLNMDVWDFFCCISHKLQSANCRVSGPKRFYDYIIMIHHHDHHDVGTALSCAQLFTDTSCSGGALLCTDSPRLHPQLDTKARTHTLTHPHLLRCCQPCTGPHTWVTLCTTVLQAWLAV